MSQSMKTIAFLGALMMINVCIASGAHWEAGVDQNANLCFEETVKVAEGADPATLRTVFCTRALRADILPRQQRSAVLFNKGIIQRAQGDLAAAQLSFERAVSLSRMVDRRNLALAEVARERGAYRVAMEQYDLLAKSTFAAGSEDLRAAILARQEEVDDMATYFAGVEKARACGACHGDNGISANAKYPTLAGREQDYLEQALRRYKSGWHHDAVMSSQARLIADEDIGLLAGYFASLEAPES